MDRSDELIRARLETFAAQAKPLGVEVDAVAAAVRRRRGAAVGAVSLGVAAIGITAAVVASVTGPSGTGAAGPPPTVRPLTCGQPLTLPTVGTGEHGLALSIMSVRRTGPDAPPDVTVGLGASEAVRIRQPSPTPPQILLLHNGIVVDVFGAPAGPPADGTGGIGRVFEVGPGAPHVQTLGGPGACPGAPWADVWRDPAGYLLVAVMSVPRTDDALPLPPEAPDTLLTVSAPVAER
jgi:hypothetical protein